MLKKNCLRALTLGLLILCIAASFSYANEESDLTIPVESITPQNASFIPAEVDKVIIPNSLIKKAKDIFSSWKFEY